MNDSPIYQGLVDETIPPREDGLTYSRFVPSVSGHDVLLDVEVHVRSHLSAVADADDDPDTRSEDVSIEHRQQPDGVLIVGFLPGARANASYLQSGHDPLAGVDPDLVREVLDGQD